MIKSKFSAVLTGVLLSLPLAAGAAYPVYQNYQGATMQPQQMGYMPSANGRMAQPQMVMQYQNGYNNAGEYFIANRLAAPKSSAKENRSRPVLKFFCKYSRCQEAYNNDKNDAKCRYI